VALAARAAEVKVFGVADAEDREDILADLPGARVFPTTFPRRWFRGQGLAPALRKEAAKLDVIHAHMLWDYPVIAAWRAARSNAKPLVITPHGALLSRNRTSQLHKQAYRHLFLAPVLKYAACIHVLTKVEELACREAGITTPLRVIPNGLPASRFGKKASPEFAYETWPVLRGRRVLLYLGRLWSGKGLDILSVAWSRIFREAESRGWVLVLAGPDYRNYLKVLTENIETQGNQRGVLIPGEVTGQLKDSLMSAAEAFVLPSHGEAFSMSLLEAMAASLPCVYTGKCGMPELVLAGGGWECLDNADALAEVLKSVIDQPPHNLRQIGNRAMNLGLNRYTLEEIADRLMNMYRECV
jgi:glycosyltransferase involved in cell wall biosynthesis